MTLALTILSAAFVVWAVREVKSILKARAKYNAEQERAKRLDEMDRCWEGDGESYRGLVAGTPANPVLSPLGHPALYASLSDLMGVKP